MLNWFIQQLHIWVPAPDATQKVLMGTVGQRNMTRHVSSYVAEHSGQAEKVALYLLEIQSCFTPFISPQTSITTCCCQEWWVWTVVAVVQHNSRPWDKPWDKPWHSRVSPWDKPWRRWAWRAMACRLWHPWGSCRRWRCSKRPLFQWGWPCHRPQWHTCQVGVRPVLVSGVLKILQYRYCTQYSYIDVAGGPSVFEVIPKRW